MAELGFLGLGNMGSAMARRLVDAGHRVLVWNRSDGPAIDALIAAGAVRVGEPADSLGAADGSFSMLANDQAALDVLDQAAFAAAAGQVHAVTASLSPGAIDELAARAAAAGARLIAAPVLGRPAVAAEGRLNILAAGADADIAALEPHLSLMGARIWRFGERPSQADVVKIAVNYNIIHAIQALGESIALVEANGVEASEFVDLLSGTLFGGVVYSGYGQTIARRAYHPAGFAMPLGRKDLGLAEGLAAAAGIDLPTARALRASFDEALADPELADADWAGLAEVVRRMR